MEDSVHAFAQGIVPHMEAYKKVRLDAEARKKEQDRVDLSETIFLWSVDVLASELKVDDLEFVRAACDALVEWGYIKKHAELTACYYLPLVKTHE